MRYRSWWPSDSFAWSETCAWTAGRLQDQIAGVSDVLRDSFQEPHSRQSEATPAWHAVLLHRLLSTNDSSGREQSANLRAPPHLVVSGATAACHSLSSSSPPSRAACQNTDVQYVGIFLDALSVARLLAWAPPRHGKLSGDHVALLQRPSDHQLKSVELGHEVSVAVLAKTENIAAQVTKLTRLSPFKSDATLLWKASLLGLKLKQHLPMFKLT